MKPYEKYKDSGVEWAGHIPNSWSLTKIKFATNNEDGKRVPISGEFRADIKGEYPYYGATGIVDYINDFIFDGSYLLIGEDGAPFFDPSRSVAFIANGKFWVNNHAHILKPKEFIGLNFLCYMLNCVDYREYITGSTRDKLTKGELSNIRVLLPTLQEQTAIANFLDHQTAIIDELIEKKTKQIALLKEKRQAIINETVTKGLDPTAKMKDSGIEWLGEIPERWEGTKMKFLGSFINGYAFKSDEFLNNGTLRVIKISNIQHMEFDWTDESFVNSKYLNDNMPCQVRKGDLVFALTRPIISTGIKASVVDFDEVMVLNQRNAIFRSNSNVLMSWIYYTMLSHQFIEQFDSKIDKTGQQPNISTSDISNISITLPPIKVQEEICEILKVKIKNIAYSESQIRLAIEKLKEYRQSLISEAVTGKIDVRGWGK